MIRKSPLKYTKRDNQPMERSLLLFENSVKSKITFREYLKRLEKFRKFCNADSYDSLSRIEPAKLQEMLEDHIMLRKKQINPNSIPVEFFAIKSFLEINEVELKWRKVAKLFPAKIKKTGRRAYTTQEIQQILSTTTELRTRAIIHFLASSGVRIGALPELRIRHLRDMPLGCKAVCIYEDTIEEYWTFISSEAVKALNEYLNKRKSEGESINPESPVFREWEFNLTKPVKAIGEKALIVCMQRALRRSGIRAPENKKSGRYDTMCNHAFRKRFLTILKNTPGIMNSTAEKLVGHRVYRDEENNIVNLDDSYNVPTLENLFGQYKVALAELAIDNMTRVQIKELQIQKEYSALEVEKQKHFEEKKNWYKTILDRVKTEGEIPDWLRPVMEEMIQDFES